MAERGIIRVYIAGPITVGDTSEHMHEAIELAEELVTAGYVPFVPHLSIVWGMVHPHDHAYWLRYDLVWLALCDVLFRMPGMSRGATREEQYAREHNIPIAWSMQQLRVSHPIGGKAMTNV